MSEPVLLKKIPLSSADVNNYEGNSAHYLNKATEICGVYYRGLPLNLAATYFSQEDELSEQFLLAASQCNRPIIGHRVVQIPNPDSVSFSAFQRLVARLDTVSAFELIPSWHGNRATYKGYHRYLSLVSEMGLPLCLEVDHFFRKGKDDIPTFFGIAKRFPMIKYWLPHFGCGVFLYWERVLSLVEQPPLLLSSVPKSLDWFGIFKHRPYKDIPIAFASDHPFNAGSSLELYARWISLNR